MPKSDIDKRLQKYQYTVHNYPITYPLVLIVLVAGILIGIGFKQISDFSDSLYVEIISIILTVGIIETWNRHRYKREQDRITASLLWNHGRTLEPTKSHYVFFEMVIRDLLNGRRIEDFNISELKVSKLEIVNTVFQHFNMSFVSWEQTIFIRTNIYWSYLKRTEFWGCRLLYTSIEHCELDNVHVVRTKFQNCRIESYIHSGNFMDVQFIECDFTDSSLHKTRFRDCSFTGCSLKNVDLREARFYNVSFDSTTILPDGSRFDTLKEFASQLERFTNPANTDNPFKVFYTPHAMESVIPGLRQSNNKQLSQNLVSDIENILDKYR